MQRIGRAKFRPVADVAKDAGLEKDERILSARQRAVANALAAVGALDKAAVDGAEIRVHVPRPADMQEFLRYGDY